MKEIIISRYWIGLFSIYMLFGFGEIGFAQSSDAYYYHSIHSHSLSVTGGRTGKISYLNQRSHRRQFKLSTTYVYDAFEKNNNDITANVFNANLQMQFNLARRGPFFLNAALGAGGYHLRAEDRLNLTFKEWNFSFVSGAQIEIFLVRNSVALGIEYEFHYTPWSDLYDFLHVPTAGLIIHFY